MIEDEENLLAAVGYSLRDQGYETLAAADGPEGLALARSERPDLVILDVMLPGLDGMEVCRAIRRDLDMPILMLTARDEEVDRIVGLEIGADDYITKPFSMRELMARVRAHLRRYRSGGGPTRKETGEGVLTSGNLVVDVAGHRASLGDAELTLRPREFALLALFLERPGRALTRGQILAALWSEDYIGDMRTVDVHVRWLREKIEDDPARPTRIATVRGVGYRFEG